MQEEIFLILSLLGAPSLNHRYRLHPFSISMLQGCKSGLVKKSETLQFLCQNYIEVNMDFRTTRERCFVVLYKN